MSTNKEAINNMQQKGNISLDEISLIVFEKDLQIHRLNKEIGRLNQIISRQVQRIDRLKEQAGKDADSRESSSMTEDSQG